MENKKDVFYLAGYDPRSYRYYYALLKRNLYKQNHLNGLNLSISPCSARDKIPYCVISGEQSRVNYHFLQWDNIVKKYWAKNLLDFLFDFAYFLRKYIFSGILEFLLKNLGHNLSQDYIRFCIFALVILLVWSASIIYFKL